MNAPRPRPEILDISPYVGGESNLPGVNRVFKLSSNEGAFGVPPGAQAAYAKLAGELHRYPDGDAAELRRAIGARFRLDPARIVCGAGSDDLIYQLCLAYGGPGREIVMSEHGFSIYQIAGTYSGSRVVKTRERNLTADVDAMLAAVSPATRLVFLANPNNPTGSMLPHAEVARLRAGLPPEVLLVLDAAYAEYVERPDYDPGITLVDGADNTVMTRTFSKIFGLGGMRIGWAYAPPAVIDVLNRVRAPFNVSIAAQAAAIAALAEPGWVETGRTHNAAFRAKLADGLRAAGIKVWPSEGNFVLADFGTPQRAESADAFLRSRGVIARPVGAYGLSHCLRITVGTAEEVGIVVDTLTEFMSPGAALGQAPDG
jgi:histidinol-phosphate aminotransferase